MGQGRRCWVTPPRSRPGTANVLLSHAGNTGSVATNPAYGRVRLEASNGDDAGVLCRHESIPARVTVSQV